MGSSTLRCAYSQCEERFEPKALAPRKRFHSQRCRTKARIERLIKQGQLDILMSLLQESTIVGESRSWAAGWVRKVVRGLHSELNQ